MENITSKKIFITILVFFFFGLYFSHWIRCSLDNRFFFSSLDLNLRIIFDVRSDGNIPLPVARVLHNKVTEGSVYLFNAYSNYWDLRFLVFLLSPVTFFGFLLWTFSIIRRKIQFRIFEKVLLLASLFLPILILLEIIKNQTFVLLLFSLPFIIFSLQGYSVFAKKNKYFWLWMFLAIILSVYMLMSFQTSNINFCQR